MGHRAIPSPSGGILAGERPDMETPRGAGSAHARGAGLNPLHPPRSEATDAAGP